MLSNFSIRHLSVIISFAIAIFWNFSFLAATDQEQLGQLSIPSIGIETSIVLAPLGSRTWEVSHLDMTVGYFQHLQWFGSNGNVVLGGHSTDSFGNPEVFYNLKNVQIGDSITAFVDDQTYVYVVTEIHNIDYQDMSVALPTDDARLTLITCDTTSYTGFHYTRRDVVIATRTN